MFAVVCEPCKSRERMPMASPVSPFATHIYYFIFFCPFVRSKFVECVASPRTLFPIFHFSLVTFLPPAQTQQRWNACNGSIIVITTSVWCVHTDCAALASCINSTRTIFFCPFAKISSAKYSSEIAWSLFASKTVALHSNFVGAVSRTRHRDCLDWRRNEILFFA